MRTRVIVMAISIACAVGMVFLILLAILWGALCEYDCPSSVELLFYISYLLVAGILSIVAGILAPKKLIASVVTFRILAGLGLVALVALFPVSFAFPGLERGIKILLIGILAVGIPLAVAQLLLRSAK